MTTYAHARPKRPSLWWQVLDTLTWQVGPALALWIGLWVSSPWGGF